MAKHRILVVEDDQAIRLFIESALKSAGYLIESCMTVATAWEFMQAHRPDLLLLDLGLPDADGRTLIKQVRSRSDMPVLILSARSQESDIVSCLDLGADDYLVKPVGVAELLARVRVALRHASVMAQRDQVVSVGELVIDLHKGLVFLAGKPVHLTPKEYALLSMLAQAQGQVITQRKLLAQVWGSEFVDYGHYVRVQMGNLRAKLEQVAAEPRYILTEPGVGYRLADA